MSKTITDIEMKRKIKIVQIMARLNIGGAAIQAILLTQGLDPNQFQSVLVTGKVSASEGDMIYLADTYGVKPIIISNLQRDIGILNDVKAFLCVLRILNREKPDIVHTHTAKAGTIGRIATFIHNLVNRDRIRVVHTFHGHVFHGYFSNIMSTMVIFTERILSKITDIIIATSESQKKELVCNYRIAQASKVRVVKLGVDLEPFLLSTQEKTAIAKKITCPALRIGIVGRLVPIKNHKMFLDSAKIFLEQNPSIKAAFIIIGDGELKQELIDYCHRLGLSDHVQFCGWKKEFSEIYTNLDIVALTSNNEGTAIALIEAMACSVPVIATNVGGVRDLVGNSQLEFISDGFKIFKRGILCRDNDAKGFAKGMEYLVKNRQLSKDIAKVAQSFVVEHYSKDRLLRDMESFYTELLNQVS
ncbi:MAG: glycosyltransferase [Desulfobacteraceae bacterium]|nr:glycosyltransferase [Desulfobacteraceae bacterium]